MKQFTGLDFHCHHVIPRYLGGDDSYENLIVLDRRIHNLIHARYDWKIKEMIKELNLNKQQIAKINKLRNQCKLNEIEID